MNPYQIDAVRDSFASLAPHADAVAEAFYIRLFGIDPGLRRLFKGDMAQQRTRLMTMLATGVQGLDRPDHLLPALRALGARHVGYGVTDAHYDTVATALFDTLADGLGERFTAALRGAWVEAYALLSGAMKAGAAMASARAA